MKKGILRIDVPRYDPEYAAGKPYRRPTYSTVADASRISIEDQAKEYALWLMKNDRHHCHLYPEGKTLRQASSEFRYHLFGLHRGELRYREVQPRDFLGKLSDNDKEGAE